MCAEVREGYKAGCFSLKMLKKIYEQRYNGLFSVCLSDSDKKGIKV